MSKKRKKEPTILAQYPDGTVERVKLSKLRDAKMPIRHPNLTDEFLKVAQWIYRWVGKDSGRSPMGLERWEAGFMHDTNPVSELALWVCIGLAADRLQSPLINRRRLVRNLCLASMGGRKPTSRESVTLNEIRQSLNGRPFEEIFHQIPDCYVD